MNGDVPIGQLFSQLVDDGKAFARAEIELYKTKAADKAQPVKLAAIYAGIALTLALSAVTALLVGLILALSTLLGPLAATLVIVLIALAIAGGLGYLAYLKIAEARR